MSVFHLWAPEDLEAKVRWKLIWSRGYYSSIDSAVPDLNYVERLRSLFQLVSLRAVRRLMSRTKAVYVSWRLTFFGGTSLPVCCLSPPIINVP
jgi:hypothetical protein